MELFIIKALHKLKPQDRQYIYMMPGGIYNVQKKIEMSPIDHLYQWEEMMCIAGLLPTGNIETPNAQLQVEWFYMTFHNLITRSTCNLGASYTTKRYRLLQSTSS
jgi:hypothetical protein